MKFKLFILLIIISLSHLMASSLPRNSILKITTVKTAPDYKYPWQNTKVYRGSGSGVAVYANPIFENLILTSAHVVSNAKYIEVEKENDPKKYPAIVQYISHQADLAFIRVQGQSFFNDLQILKLADKVSEGESIHILGYPMGGKALSITKGIVSRIEETKYSWSDEVMTTTQVDAAMNPGNSGGAALNASNEIVGISMQKITQSSNIAYLVPSSIIKTFIEDIEDGRVHGYAKPSFYTQPLINQELRKHYKVDDSVRGVYITNIDPNEKQLRKGDILLAIDGKSIENDATVNAEHGRLRLESIFYTLPVGYKIKLRVLRNNKKLDFNYKLKRKYSLVKTEYNEKPRYLIYGGLVFSPLTTNYIKAHNYFYKGLLQFFEDNCRTKHIKEPVMLHYEKLSHQVNMGYKQREEVVKSVNGVRVVNFAHFIKLIDENKEPYTVIDFMEWKHKKIILDTKKARESFQELKQIYNIPSDRRL